jgi:hypothetical protein
MGDVIVQRGQIWWARVPYLAGPPGEKDRPIVILGCEAQAPRRSAHVLAFPTSTFGGDPTKAQGGDLRITAGDLVDAPTFGDDSFLRARRLISINIDRILFDRGLLGSVTKSLMARATKEVILMLDCGMTTYDR